jgi:hypothetical protein
MLAFAQGRKVCLEEIHRSIRPDRHHKHSLIVSHPVIGRIYRSFSALLGYKGVAFWVLVVAFAD